MSTANIKYHLQAIEQNAVKELSPDLFRTEKDDPLTNYRILAHANIDYLSTAASQEKTNAYLIMRAQFAEQGPRYDNKFDQIITAAHPRPSRLPVQSHFNLSSLQVETLTDLMRQTGYCVLPDRLDRNFVRDLKMMTAVTPIRNRIIIPEVELTNVQPLSNLIHDSVILEIASAYLNCVPIFSSAHIFVSGESDTTLEAMNDDARLFHFDKDWLKWVKVFIYLSDVGELSGPHLYVDGGNRRSGKLLRDGRFSDEEIIEQYGQHNVRSILGDAGTVFIGDTSTLHRAANVVSGSRYVLQLEYTNSLFGNPAYVVPNPELAATLRAFTSFNPEYERLAIRY